MKEIKPRISVIVPVYNVSRYVERCARSLFSQTMDELEFIFVDDCSPDNSIDIIKNVLMEFPERANSVVFCYHNENKGLPTARKTGFEHSRGQYIAHCDSDDWISPDMYSTMYIAARENCSDIVYCDYFKSNGIHSRIISVPDYRGGLLQGPVWNKIVKKELYNNIVFPIANKAEDGAIMTQLSFFANTVSVVHIPLYYYFDNPESICLLPTKEACIKRWSQECCNTDLRVDFLMKHKVAEIYRMDIIMMKYYSLSNLIPFLKDDSVFRLWESKYSEIKEEMGLLSKVPIRIRVSYFLMRHRLVNILIALRGH